MEIIGGDSRVEGITNNIETDSDIEISKILFRVLRTPCHTTGLVKTTQVIQFKIKRIICTLFLVLY